jgi:hypothetical protein
VAGWRWLPVPRPGEITESRSWLGSRIVGRGYAPAMPRRWWRRTARPGPDAVPDQAGPDAVLADQPDPDTVRPDLLAWAQVVDVSRLSDKTVRWAEDYLRRHRRMTLGPSQEEGFRLMSVIEPQINPPPPVGVHPLDAIATVLAVRRKQLGIG